MGGWGVGGGNIRMKVFSGKIPVTENEEASRTKTKSFPLT